VAGFCGALAACQATSGTTTTTSKIDPELGVEASPRVVADGQAVPRGGGRYQVGKAYQVAGKWYKPKEDRDYDRIGLASWYGSDFHGRLTANGEIFDRTSLSAAHPTLPLPSYARVTNLTNHRSVIVRVNDRGPYSHTRLIDVSEGTAELLDFKRVGTAKVRVQYIEPARMDGNDERMLLASYEGPGTTPKADTSVMLASAEPRRRPTKQDATGGQFMLAAAAPARPSLFGAATRRQAPAAAEQPIVLASAEAPARPALFAPATRRQTPAATDQPIVLASAETPAQSTEIAPAPRRRAAVATDQPIVLASAEATPAPVAAPRTAAPRARPLALASVEAPAPQRAPAAAAEAPAEPQPAAPQKRKPPATKAVAFAEQAATDTNALEAVQLLSTPADAESRISMAFETVSEAGQ
jgi:rare lipoprotein A